MLKSSKIKPCLWFEDQAEDAARFYTSIFQDSKITAVSRFPAGSPRPEGMAMTVAFQLEGRDFMALNGGPEYRFTPAVSFVVECRDQAEIDTYWDKLGADGGQPVQCGWVTDRYGLSWQIVPAMMDELFNSGDAKKAERAMQAMLKMVKLDIAKLEEAAK